MKLKKKEMIIYSIIHYIVVLIYNNKYTYLLENFRIYLFIKYLNYNLIYNDIIYYNSL